jgi:hypothetical protein
MMVVLPPSLQHLKFEKFPLLLKEEETEYLIHQYFVHLAVSYCLPNTMPILIRPTAALLALVLCVAITDASRSLPHFDQWMHRPPEEPGSLWALLVAGSAGYGNYRHQADVAHAYHVLRRGGIAEQRIVVMMYDDVAWSPQNPRPGTLYNHPSLTQELRGGLRIDYSGDHVNAQEFLAVLSGNVVR